MNIIIKTKNLDLTDSLVRLINRKIGSLKKFIKIFKDDNLPVKKGKTLSEVFVEVEKETKHHRKGDIFRAETTIHLPGKSLVAKSHGENLSKAITDVKEELKREIRKYKTKTIELPRRKYRKIKRETEI